MPLLKYTVFRVLPNSAALVRRNQLIPRLALGLSLDNPRFSGESLEGILAWCAENSQECLLFLGDALYERTYRQLHPDKPQEAGPAASRLADKALDEICRYTSAQTGCRFVTIKLSSIAAQSGFSQAQQGIDSLYRTDNAFRNSINAAAQKYVARRQKHHQLTGSSEAALSRSVAYLIDEIAYYQVLCDQGWLTETYPGHEMPVLADILKGLVPRAPEILKRRVFIELKATSSERQKTLT